MSHEKPCAAQTQALPSIYPNAAQCFIQCSALSRHFDGHLEEAVRGIGRANPIAADERFLAPNLVLAQTITPSQIQDSLLPQPRETD